MSLSFCTIPIIIEFLSTLFSILHYKLFIDEFHGKYPSSGLSLNQVHSWKSSNSDAFQKFEIFQSNPENTIRILLIGFIFLFVEERL